MNQEDLAYERVSIWNSAYDDCASNEGNYNSPKKYQYYADSKLDAFDNKFYPSTFVEELILVEKTVDVSEELYKCAYDVRYFIETYCGIKLRPTQYKILHDVKNADRSLDVELYGRQEGSTLISSLYLLHTALFNSYFHISIVSPNLSHSKDILHKIGATYQDLPDFFKQGKPPEMLKNSITFNNGTKLMTMGSAMSFKGYSMSVVYLDNVTTKFLQEFQEMVYPVIACNKSGQVINIATR